AVLQRQGNSVERAAESGQQRRVGIEQPSAVGGHELWHQDLVETREDDKLRFGALNSLAQSPLTLCSPRNARPVDEAYAQAGGLRAGDRRRAAVIAPDQHDSRGEIWFSARLEQRLQVGARA